MSGTPHGHRYRGSREHSNPPPQRTAGCSHDVAGPGLAGKVRWAWRWVWLLLVRNRLLIAVASLIWLIWRSGTQPRRLAYPCQQAAAANLGVFAVLVVPALARRRRGRRGTLLPAAVQLATGSVALAGVLFVLISAGVAVFSDANDTYEPGHPALVPWTPVDLSAPVQMSPRVFVPNGAEAVVAVDRNLNVQYGVEPYGPGTNSAYDLTFKTIADLHLGPPENPLADFVQDVDGDGTIEVIIKPNHVQYEPNDGTNRSPVYSHPAIFRPLVDMLALAGAQQVFIGDGCGVEGGAYFTQVADQAGLTQQYVGELQASANSLPGVGQQVTVQRVDFQNLGYWSWTGLGSASAYQGSGYVSGDLLKPHVDGTYFAVPDAHGRPGPGQSNCRDWLAISDHILNPDIIIDLAKLKVHYYGISTCILKNWVGITMLSTYDYSWLGGCRIAHEVDSATNYEKAFGNDIMWRELLNAHRAAIYWRDSSIRAVPQRRYLCLIDAINCGERYHVGMGYRPWPYWLYTMVASVDPVAIDAVGARLQRYDFRNIPIINNAHAASIGSPWPVGTGDPGQVRVVGDQMIDSSYSHQFLFDDAFGSSWPDWSSTVINDLNPPTVNILTAQDLGDGRWQVHADINNGHVAYYYYGNAGGGAPQVVRLARNGNAYDAIASGPAGNGTLVAQDAYFNTVRAQVVNMPAIGLSTHRFDPIVYYGEVPLDDLFTVTNIGVGTLHYSIELPGDPPWLHVDSVGGSSTSEPDPVIVSYTPGELMPGTYTAIIRVSDPAASNSPQDILVTLEIQTVVCDLDRDGDVDQSDFGRLQACLSGSGTAAGPDCVEADFNHDTDVDSADCALLRECLSGAGVIADKTCDDQPG